jgi:adenylate cyclase
VNGAPRPVNGDRSVTRCTDRGVLRADYGYVSAMTDGSDVHVDGLADNPNGASRLAGEQLVAWLVERGFSADQIRGSATPAFLPAARRLGDDGRFVSAREIAESADIDIELLQRLQDAIGLPRVEDPDAAVLLRADAEAAGRLKFFLDMGIGLEETLALVRAVMAGLTPVAAMLREAALKTILRPGATELEIAQASEKLANMSVPAVGPMLDDLLRVEMRRLFEISAVTEAERAAGELPGARQITVAFADLAGFTILGETVPPEQLQRLANRLTELAREVAVSPVRFVKSIGDAVMLVSPTAIPLLNATLDLSDAAAAADLPSLRTGIASGRAISRAGDWFGTPVNVASRITAIADPRSVLVDEPTWNLAGGAPDLAWTRHGARRLKGIRDEIALFIASRPPD